GFAVWVVGPPLGRPRCGSPQRGSGSGAGGSVEGELGGRGDVAGLVSNEAQFHALARLERGVPGRSADGDLRAALAPLAVPAVGDVHTREAELQGPVVDGRGSGVGDGDRPLHTVTPVIDHGVVHVTGGSRVARARGGSRSGGRRRGRGGRRARARGRASGEGEG